MDYWRIALFLGSLGFSPLPSAFSDGFWSVAFEGCLGVETLIACPLSHLKIVLAEGPTLQGPEMRIVRARTGCCSF